MGTKNLLNIVLLFFCSQATAQTEIQHKYDVENKTSFSSFIRSSDSLGQFKTVFHSNLTYYDLYFDTPDQLLFKNGYSLRMRKKEEGQGVIAYVFQLKSEMTLESSVRMEVEEKELDFYQLNHSGDSSNLAKVLNELFTTLEKSKERESTHLYSEFIFTIRNWIKQKSQAPIAPFQKLNFLNPEVFSFHTISKLEPVMIGMSRRLRSHIYLNQIDAKELGAIAGMTDLEKDRPQFFIDKTHKIWILESSLDSAVFYPLIKTDHIKSTIVEYEIENKFSDPVLGEDLIHQFERLGKVKFGFASNLKSKYAQSMNVFNGIE